MRSVLVVLAVGLSACRPQSQTLDSRSDADVVAAAPAAVAPSASSPKRNGYSEAVFVAGALVSCLDVDATGFTPQPADAGAQPIDGTCADSFHDRVEFASCTNTASNPDAGRAYTAVTHTYDYASVADNDRLMQDCLKSRGKWKALDRTSPEWQLADAEYQRKKLEKQLGR